jgi:N-acetylglucosamine-6-sulfatase
LRFGRTALASPGLVLALALAAWSPLSGAAAAAEPEGTARPNFVFILVDDLRYDALGSTGSPIARTPNIDRIAGEGTVCRNAFVTTPLCSPSRSSFLTGQYVHKTGILGNGNNNERSHQLVTFPARLQKAGYETAYVGKWHMGNDDSPRPGFDRWVSFPGQGNYIDPVINVDGTSSKVQGYMTDILNDHAVDFLSRPHNKPFVLYLAHKAVHGPFTPAERHKGLYADATVPHPPSAEDTLEGKPALRRRIEEPAAKKKKDAAKPKAKAKQQEGGGGGQGGELIRNQLRCLASIDEGVGRIFKALESSNQLDRTLIVFTSDNGYFWGEHGLGDKRAAYEESIRIPLVMRYPPLIKAGSSTTAPVLNIDIAPTLLDLAGVTIPADIHGRSLAPLLRGETRGWRPSFLSEYFAEPGYPRIPTWQAVRSDRWKYIHYTELTGMDELYDLRYDPHEMKNLIAEPSAATPLAELKQALEEQLRRSQ